MKFRYSLLIYTVSKESEKADGENYQSVLLAIINKVFNRSGIHGIIINSRILEVFRKKISCLEKAVKKASKCGGRQLNVLLTKLRTGPCYQFKVYYNEVDVVQLKNENSKLRGEKRVLEESLVQETAKRLRVDKKAKKLSIKLRRKVPSTRKNLCNWPKK